MDNSDVQLVGGPCGQHGPYTFYKAFKYTKNGVKRIVTLSEFFFVKMWRDSDLLCIGELQLLWNDKNSEQVLASLRLYFLPENTPEGRMDHGEDEVLSISEKVVIRVEDLITWITVEAEWNWGKLAKCDSDMESVEVEPSEFAPPRKYNGTNFSLTETSLDFTDVESERKNFENAEDDSAPHVIILSFPKYCRYRAMMKRLEGVEDFYLKHKIVHALGGFYVKHPNTRVLFCKETFDYPELEGHELLCNHLAPKLKGRPRGKRKKRSVSPGSESNGSESSNSNNYNTRAENKNGINCNTNSTTPRRSTRCHENNENKEFVRKLGAFMKSNHTPIGRIPSLGYKELNLHEFFTKVQKLGGYDCVTTNRLWKSIFDDMSGHQNSTSAATVIRRHYERFLLPYERHLKGEEYKPLPVSERRRLKSKRGSNSISDPESGNCDPAVPSTSKRVSPSTSTEHKEHVRTEGKPSSLRSIRVKPERQKDKKVSSEKDSVSNNNNNNNVTSPSEQQTVVNKTDANQEAKPKVEKLIIKTDSMTVKTDCSNGKSPLIKIEYATVVKSEKASAKSEGTEDMPVSAEIIPIKVEEPLKVEPAEVKTELVKAEESAPVKIEPVPVKIEPVTKPESKYVPEKNAEPVTSAVTPVVQKLLVDQLISPVEGKENIPLIKTGDVATKNSPEVIEVPYKPKPPERIHAEPDAFKSTFIQEVKKRKLDILKEGGLEVTPVRPSLMKDNRPSVIHQASPPVQVIPKTIKVEIMPPPSSNTPVKKSQASFSQVRPGTPTKKAKPGGTNSFQFVNGLTPPKVVQSKSIYSYSEKTVYGNPKDVLPAPSSKPAAVPRFVSTPRQNGGDPVDLSVGSPQKPVVEIMRVPQIGMSSPYNRDTVTKNLYKVNAPTIMDARRLGPNLEITLVGPNNKTSPVSHKPYNYLPPNYTPQKRLSSDYYSPSKMAKSEENGRYRAPTIKPADIVNVPQPFKARPEHNKPQPSSSMKPFPNSGLPGFPPYFAQLYEQTAKGLPPYLPLLDPAMYYSAAMQSLYSANTLSSAPMLPIPTPEQLKFYTELMAHGRLNFPFHLPQDGSSSAVNNNLKKQ